MNEVMEDLLIHFPEHTQKGVEYVATEEGSRQESQVIEDDDSLYPSSSFPDEC